MKPLLNLICNFRGDLMVNAVALVFGLSGLGSSPGWRHCLVFLGKTLYSPGAFLHPGVSMGTGELMLGVTLRGTTIPSRGEKKYSKSLHATKTGISSGRPNGKNDYDEYTKTNLCKAV